MNLFLLCKARHVYLATIITYRRLSLINVIISKKKLSTFETRTDKINASKHNITSDIILNKKPNNFENQKNDSKPQKIVNIAKTLRKCDTNNRFNPLGIQMISSSLRQKLFGSNEKTIDYDKQKLNEIKKQLKTHGLNTEVIESDSILSDFNIEKYLPKLLSNDLSQHFELLGERLSEKYKRLAFDLIQSQSPEPPKHWVFSEGWTRYYHDSNGQLVSQKVEFPLENDLVFDVEICMKDSDGRKPTLATAVSSKAWYSWCSQRLIDNKRSSMRSEPSLNDMIPMGRATDAEKLIVGHNVSFDRSFIREQYDIDCDKTRFLDTMSLHICVSGLTQHQRALSYSQKIKDLNQNFETNGERPVPHLWKGVGSLNNLVDVFHLYCDEDEVISKDPRNIFIDGSISDVFDNFQELMTYCAKDVSITLRILKSLFPTFLDRFPHPISFAGMLEMSVMYLPVIPHNWNRYISECDSIYDYNERELNLSLREIATDACSLAKDKQYTQDVWLWDLDWTTQPTKFKKPKPEAIKRKKSKTETKIISKEFDKNEDKNGIIAKIMATSSLLYKNQPLMPGYPKWFVEFCSKLKYDFEGESEVTAEDLEWESGPYLISTQMRSVPKLLRLLWNSYPIHYDTKHGWGYLMPDPTMTENPDTVPGTVDDYKNTIYFPYKRFRDLVESRQKVNKSLISSENSDLDSIIFEETDDLKNCGKAYDDVIKGCLFYRLPHKGGPDKRVGNPLSKDFLKRVNDGSLTSFDNEITDSVILQSKRLSYWRNASKRIRSQLMFSLNEKSGAILPRVIVAGTVTRRAVEQTWLTASNVVSDRLGSELKSMIQCFDGYHYVGADVDSQELWIASLIGDSHFSKIHGSTGIGWMTLKGNRANGTDMHSKTAASINISRDEAKVLNYARIYGSGQLFASRFLIQSNPDLSQNDSKEKAKKIFIETKGRRKSIKTLKRSELENEESNDVLMKRREWTGGTESQMFNKLEQIAESEEPRTPVLGCRISRCLEPRIVGENYMTSRVNWVVQSSAVDFLHIMLVSMKWLLEEMEINGRFSISIHDELRYIVKSEDRYKAALALQLSNLLTRSLFSLKLGLNDLPLSVAFFSRVDIDKCLRKEVDIDSKTPSNPLGLQVGYGIPFGESLDISELINKIK